jgi:hypothetical protein
MPNFTIVWLDRESKTRRRATRSDEASARQLVRELAMNGHGDVRYSPPGERHWKAVRTRKGKVRRKRPETPFPPSAKTLKMKQQHEKKGSDALDKRLPGSFESGKRR